MFNDPVIVYDYFVTTLPATLRINSSASRPLAANESWISNRSSLFPRGSRLGEALLSLNTYLGSVFLLFPSLSNFKEILLSGFWSADYVGCLSLSFNWVNQYVLWSSWTLGKDSRLTAHVLILGTADIWLPFIRGSMPMNSSWDSLMVWRVTSFDVKISVETRLMWRATFLPYFYLLPLKVLSRWLS